MFEIRRQTSQNQIKDPIMTEMRNYYRPYTNRSKDMKPWNSYMLEKHIYINKCIHIYIHTYIHIHIHVNMFTYIHIYIDRYRSIYRYISICVYIYIYIYRHIQPHIHTCIHTQTHTRIKHTHTQTIYIYIRGVLRGHHLHPMMYPKS